MLVTSVTVDCTNVAQTLNWSSFRVPLTNNRFQRARVHLTGVFVFGSLTHDAAGILSNVLELRVKGTEQVYTFTGKWKDNASYRYLSIENVKIHFELDTIHNQRDFIEMEFRMKVILPNQLDLLLQQTTPELWYPVFMNSNSQFLDYGPYAGTGTYTVNANSADLSTDIYRAFNRDYTTEHSSLGSRYNTSNGNYEGNLTTSSPFGNQSGEWIQVTFPVPLYITGFRFYRNPATTFTTMQDGTVIGYNPTGTIVAHPWQSSIANVTGWQTRTFTTPGVFQTLRLVCRRIYNQDNSSRFRVDELVFLGRPIPNQPALIPDQLRLQYIANV